MMLDYKKKDKLVMIPSQEVLHDDNDNDDVDGVDGESRR